MQSLQKLRDQLAADTYANETLCVENLLRASQQESGLAQQISDCAADLVQRSRQQRNKRGTLDAFLDEFGLSNREGVALMCLAEALLRIPDSATADALIAEKVHSGDWSAHQGHSDSLFVNASVWGMLLTGKIVALESDITQGTSGWFRGLVSRVGEPVVRRAMLQAMRIMGGQYILGRTIGEALKRGPAENSSGTRFSFDMLGEGARSDDDAQRYFQSYLSAIERIASAGDRTQPVTGVDGISVKLSALHPHYQQSKATQVTAQLLPRLKHLAMAAKAGNIGFNIDAEESERLDISLELLASLAHDPDLAPWDGLGFVLQAYQKRAPLVADWLIQLAKNSNRRLMLRLVKGAYWDTEIKQAQALGLADYPVYTRKENTDLSYQLCAKKLLDAADAVFPQFATHNAHTVATVLTYAEATNISAQSYEFQRLHGMGQLLYEQLHSHCEEYKREQPHLRVYAPVGEHRDLLPYLVRRLLENGANSSFVNRFLNETTPVAALVSDVRDKVAKSEPKHHPHIALPAELYAQATPPRRNAAGIQLEDKAQANSFIEEFKPFLTKHFDVGPIINGETIATDGSPHHSPAQKNQQLGTVRNAAASDIDRAIASAAAAQKNWDAGGVERRAELIEKVADLLDRNGPELIAMISREAGRTLKDAHDELREAVDFCYYYSGLAKQHFVPEMLPGPTGETNQLSLHGRGVFLCISPWNFPLAIFIGQVVAALAAGNTVIAKPAEQTPMVAHLAITLMHAAGIPGDVLQLITGIGRDIGEQLVNDARVKGVVFTGSTETAQLINRQIAHRDTEIIPLIAETGGLNAMIADSSALPEQLVDDIIGSAFLSAGQRCSALRVLFLQQDIADGVLSMLRGACDALQLGEPWELDTDIGPVIDARAKATLEDHIARLGNARCLYAYPREQLPSQGHFVGPHIFQIDQMQDLQREVFGPILHVVLFKSGELKNVLQQINTCPYGLTLGVHSRIESRARYIFQNTQVGNTYVNRDMVGAVVGVNPFGGQGLSGTGPKAGGPRYLFRFATEKTLTINTAATGGNVDLFRSISETPD